MGDIGMREYKYLLSKLEELKKELSVQQVRLNLLTEDHRCLVKTLKALGIDEFHDTEA